jgi:hypothetical protein
MGTRIDELNPGDASEDHKIAAMLDSHTVFVTVVQILNLAKGKLPAWFHGSPSKTTPVDADEVPIYNSVGAVLDRVTFANLWSWIASKFHAATAKTLPLDADEIYLGDSAASFAMKRVTLANFWSWISGDPYIFQPIGVPFATNVGLGGTGTPSNAGRAKYIKLTAGLTAGYNSGLIGSESTTGSAPLILSFATITLAGSPLVGSVVRHINTEGRILRPSASPGTLQDDAVQGHIHVVNLDGTAPSGAGGAGGTGGSTNRNTGSPVSDGTNGPPRTANETRMRNWGTEYYMRIL